MRISKNRRFEISFVRFEKDMFHNLLWTSTNPIDINFAKNGIEAFYDEFKNLKINVR